MHEGSVLSCVKFEVCLWIRKASPDVIRDLLHKLAKKETVISFPSTTGHFESGYSDTAIDLQLPTADGPIVLSYDFVF